MIEKGISYRIKYLIIALMMIGFVDSTQAQQDDLSLGSLKTVVIDAGHGGKDPGCHGASSQEKTVCLSMALQLGAKIKKEYPHINVIYTRDTDVFVELDERAKIANRNKADLFICIHANAASASAYGTETYVLGLHRTKAQENVAARENAIIHLEDDGGAKYESFDMSPDAIIARQLQLSVFLDQSISFASKLQAEFTKIGRHNRGVKQAGFLVLYKTTMPSVLIETGFLTNPTEEKFLSDSTTQAQMAASMFKAFKKYKNELEGIDEQTDIEDTAVPVEVEIEEPLSTDIVFRVQIETSDSKIPLTDSKFKGNTIYEYNQNGLYKYTVGSYVNDFNSANTLKTKMRSDGFDFAFVVAFLNGERINLEKAINLAKK